MAFRKIVVHKGSESLANSVAEPVRRSGSALDKTEEILNEILFLCSVKDLKSTYMQTLPWAGIAFASLRLQVKQLDHSPREVRFFS